MKSITTHLALLLIMLPVAGRLNADDYHNINGFFGERAAGLGGAYTAIADDPSGALYNPAGLAYAYDNFMSLSASAYSETKKTYENVFGPGQNYTRKSRTYLPNFFGAIRNYDSVKVGVALITPQNQQFDQADQISFPLMVPRASNFRNDYTEENTDLMIGPSVGYAVGERFSLGASLFYQYDANRITSTQVVTRYDGSYSSLSVQDRRKTGGLVPVLGAQFMPNDSVALGLSLSRNFVVSGDRRQTATILSSTTSTANLITFLENTDRYSAQGGNGVMYTGPGLPGDIPELLTARAGAAVFLSRYLLVAGDLIYTGGYKRVQDRTQIDALSASVIINNPEVQELSRAPTTNIALGLEYYLNENLAVRAGFFTNNANSEPIDWRKRTAINVVRSINNGELRNTIATGRTVVYREPAFDTLERFEYVNNRGLSLGIAWADARSSISVSVVREVGKGTAQIDSSLMPQTLLYKNLSVYIVASTRN